MEPHLVEFDEQRMVWFIIDRELVRYEFDNREMAEAFILEVQQEVTDLLEAA